MKKITKQASEQTKKASKQARKNQGSKEANGQAGGEELARAGGLPPFLKVGDLYA